MAQQGLTLTYKGVSISYVENTNGFEPWTCRELNLTASQLPSLREKIDKSDLERRRVNIPALRFQRYALGVTDQSQRDSLGSIRVILLIDAKQCWIENEKGEREKVYVSSLFPDGPPTREAHRKYLAAREAYYRASDVMKAAEEALPQITLERAS